MTPTRRLNLRALFELAIVLLVIVPGVAGLALYRRSAGASYLVEAKALFAKGKTAPGMGYLNRHLELNPNDLEALDLKAKILAEEAGDEALAVEAARIHSQVLGRSTTLNNQRETRRRLVRLDLKIPSHAYAAEEQARALIRDGADDAEAHRLLARALEQLGILEKKAALIDQARVEYELAEAKEPGDVEGAQRLATLYRDRMENPSKALAVLDQLVKTCEGSPASKRAAARLARARHFNATGQPDLAAKDVDQAVQADPNDIEARLIAAELALQRRDTEAARKHVEALDAARRDDSRVVVTSGLIDLVEQRPDDAIKHWREGLVKSQGNDPELTWRLAHVLLETGRVTEAEPLIDQYHRLVGGDDPPPRQRYLKALALLQKNRAAEAVAELEAIRFKVDKGLAPHAFQTLGRAYEATGEPTRALEAYRLAAENSRDWSAPWAAAARVQSQALGQPSEALATLERGLAVYPEDPALLTALAGLSWRSQAEKPAKDRNWSAFEAILKRARKVAPGSAELALVEADYDAATGRADVGLALLAAATRVNPRATDLWLARANASARAGKLGKALDILDQGLAAAGPQANLYVSKASMLSLKGLLNEARDVLVDSLKRVPDEQKPLLWKTLGDFDRARGDLSAARQAYNAWIELQPDNPEPRLSLVDLAITSDDPSAISAAVEALKGVGGPKSQAWRIARVEQLLRAKSEKLDEAETLIKEIQTADPKLAAGFLLEARLRVRKHEVDRAIAAYEQALKLESGTPALAPLVALLVREKRDADLARLKETLDARTGGLDRIAAMQTLKLGDGDRASRLAAMAAQGDPQGVDARVWQAEVLQALGKPDEAEAALKLLVENKPDNPSPWLQLLMLQVSRNKTAEAAATIDAIKSTVKVDYPEVLWAQCYRAIGDTAKAEASYDQALTRWADVPEVLASSAAFFERIGRVDKAESTYRVLLKRDPSSGWTTRKLAVLLATRQGNRAAWEEALGLIGPDPRPDDIADDALARASVYAQSPDPSHKHKAVAILNGLLAETPNRRDVHETLARWMYAWGEASTSTAREHITKAAEGERATPESILLYANMLLGTRDLDAAEAELSRLVARDPDGLPVAELKYRILTARAKPDEAADVIEAAFQRHANAADRVDVAETAARLLVAIRKLDVAERIAGSVGDVARGKCLVASLKAIQGKDAEARTILKEVASNGEPAVAFTTALGLSMRPEADASWFKHADELLNATNAKGAPSFDLLEKTAILRHFQKRYNDEVATYSAMLKQKPTNFGFLNNMAWTISEEMNQPAVGIKWADEAIRRVGELPTILDTRGVILTRLGRLDEAIRDLQNASRGMPSASVFYHLARAYKTKGEVEACKAARDRAKQAGLNRAELQPSDQADFDAIMSL